MVQELGPADSPTRLEQQRPQGLFLIFTGHFSSPGCILFTDYLSYKVCSGVGQLYQSNVCWLAQTIVCKPIQVLPIANI